MPLTRRFMVLAVMLSAALSTSALDLLLPEERAEWRLRRLLRHPDSARAVGAAYRRTFPAEADPPKLTGLLLSSLSLDEARLARQSDASLRALVVARMRNDFAAGHTATIDGWILSRTEARLCALWG
jgi:hypothetical protein